MRFPVAALALLAAVAALAACGSKEKLSEDQANQFNNKAEQFSKSMTNLNTRATKCSSLSSSGNVNAVANCFARIFDDISENFDEISVYVSGLSTEVEGTCSVKLKSVSKTLGEVSDQFSDAAKDFKAGDLNNLNEKLGDKRLNEIGPALDAAETACT